MAARFFDYFTLKEKCQGSSSLRCIRSAYTRLKRLILLSKYQELFQSLLKTSSNLKVNRSPLIHPQLHFHTSPSPLLANTPYRFHKASRL